MGRLCVVYGCSIRSNNKEGISTHGFPKEPVLIRRAWVNFVKTTRKDFVQPKDYQRICAKHFTSDAFADEYTAPLFEAELGYRPKRKLKKDAVPTLIPETCQQALRKRDTAVKILETADNTGISRRKRRRKREIIKVSSRKLPQDREDAWHRTLEKKRAKRRKLTTFNTHNSCSIAEEDHPAIFCQKHLTMPAASVLLHDYDGAIAIDSSKMVELSNGLDVTVAQQSQRCSSRRTVTHKNQRPSRRRKTHGRSKSLSQDSDQTAAGGRSNSQQESPESKQMSAVKIEIDIADDPAQLSLRESSSQVSGHCRSAVPHVQVMKTEPDGEYNCHSAQCQEAVTEELASHEYSMDVKQEKDRDLCSCNQELSTEQLHAFELGMDIKQEIDMSSCSHSEDISTKQYLAGELGMEIKHEKNLDVHQDSSQCHESELCMGIKQEKDTDVGFACGSFISEQFQAFDYKVNAKIKQEKDTGYAEAFSSEQYYSSNFGIEIKQEVGLDGS